MYSDFNKDHSLKLKLVTFLLWTGFLNVSQASQSTGLPKLEIKPKKCVSLRQKQACYLKVTVSWKVKDADKYCLHSTQQVKPIKCWPSTGQGTYSYDVTMEQDVTYTLSNKSTGKVIVSNKLPLAWVYKKEKFSHSSWRIF
ncbi:MAG: DUF3019 domain-containing protein [Paraglaciecola sp.]|nr:DUF3019 domain-containing protein [Paraglaciecola sp.]